MRSRPEWERGREFDFIQRSIRGRLLYIPLTWHIYERTEDGEGVCKVREEPDLHLVINRRTRRRWLRREGQCEPEFREVIDQARRADPDADEPPQVELQPLDFTIAESSLPLAKDERHRVIGAFGGQRGSKTHTASQWMVRQWMLKGGLGAFGWWCAPSRQQAWEICAGKLAGVGPKGDTPLCPELVVQCPTTFESGLQRIVLIDGSYITLMALDERRKGGNAKGFGPHWMVVDEVCELKSVAIWRVLRGRVNRTPSGEKAQIFMPSTPMPGHWAKTEIVDVVNRGGNPDYTYGTLSMATNVFIPRSELEAAIRDQGGVDDPVCKREVLGQWDTGNRLWTGYSGKHHIVDDTSMRALGLRDVTASAMRRAFGREALERAGVSLKELAGHDFNRAPQNSVIGKIGVPRELAAPHLPEDEILVIVDHVQRWGVDADVHGYELAAEYPEKLAIVCDPQGAQVGFKRKQMTKESITEAEDLARGGHFVVPAHVSDDGHPYSPPQITNCDLVNRLFRAGRIRVYRACGELLSSLEGQERLPRGGIDKGDERKNRISGPTDALRYLVWFLYLDEIFVPNG